MKIEKVNIADLISPSYNPRDITPAEMEKLKNSIQEFDYIDPLIVNDVNMHIIGGNQRFEALKQLGYNEIEVSFVHIEDPNREKALNLRLNKMSGDWDTIKLNEILEELEINHFDISLTGFDEFDEEIEFKNLLGKMEFDETPRPKPKTEETYTNEQIGNAETLSDEEIFNDDEEFEETEPAKPLGYYNITLLFDTEEEMTEAFDKLVADGYNCRMSNS